MTIEYLPVGIACNLSCSYCYQDPMRDAGNINVPRNWPRVKEVLESYNSAFSVFGGEPLLAPIEHLEEVWKFGYEKFGSNGIQTNGVLITEDHIDLFKKYRVQVGVSIDGPAEMNSLRCAPEQTSKSINAIWQLCEEGIPPSLIITIHQKNASSIGKLTTWLDALSALGVRHVNFHMLEVEKGREGLSEAEEIIAFMALYEWSRRTSMTTEPFGDIRKLLLEENPKVSCIWNHCDPATTAAVQGVNPDGSKSNCGRTNKDGVNWVKADQPGFERYLLLRQTPQAVGGCAGCKFFIFCKGQCPGTAIDGDWRNRTANCRTWYSLFEAMERDIELEGKIPLSKNIPLRSIIEGNYLRRWNGADHGDTPHGDMHCDTNESYSGGIPGVIVS